MISAAVVSVACTSAAGPQGPAGPAGPTGPQGEVGPQGPMGPAGSADTPTQVLGKLAQVDGPDSGVDADLLDGVNSDGFVRRGGPKKLGLPLHAVLATGASAVMPEGIYLNSSALSNFNHSFVVPEDYALGTNLRLNVLWSTTSTGCTFVFFAPTVAFARVGHVSDTPVGNAAGITHETSANDVLTLPGVANTAQVATFLITPHDNFAEILPGDVVTLGLSRSPANANDTCTDPPSTAESNLVIRGLYVTYTSN